MRFFLHNFSYWLSNYLEENVWYNVMSVNTDKVEFYVHGYPLPQIPKWHWMSHNTRHRTALAAAKALDTTEHQTSRDTRCHIDDCCIDDCCMLLECHMTGWRIVVGLSNYTVDLSWGYIYIHKTWAFTELELYQTFFPSYKT